MDDLVVFLRARLAEDEQVAREVSTGPNVPEKWTAVQYREGVRPWRIDGQCSLVVEAVCGPDAAHIARHDPARVLAEVEAKLRMLRHYESAVTSLANAGTSGQVHDLMTGAVNTLRAVLLDHAQVYVTHPDFKPEWSTA